MSQRMKIIRPRPQGRAVDINGEMIRSGETGWFDEATIASRPGWFEPAPAPKPKPKPKAKAKPKAAKAAKADKPKSTKKATKKSTKRSTTDPK